MPSARRHFLDLARRCRPARPTRKERAAADLADDVARCAPRLDACYLAGLHEFILQAHADHSQGRALAGKEGCYVRR